MRNALIFALFAFVVLNSSFAYASLGDWYISEGGGFVEKTTDVLEYTQYTSGPVAEKSYSGKTEDGQIEIDVGGKCDPKDAVIEMTGICEGTKTVNGECKALPDIDNRYGFFQKIEGRSYPGGRLCSRWYYRTVCGEGFKFPSGEGCKPCCFVGSYWYWPLRCFSCTAGSCKATSTNSTNQGRAATGNCYTTTWYTPCAYNPIVYVNGAASYYKGLVNNLTTITIPLMNLKTGKNTIRFSAEGSGKFNYTIKWNETDSCVIKVKKKFNNVYHLRGTAWRKLDKNANSLEISFDAKFNIHEGQQNTTISFYKEHVNMPFKVEIIKNSSKLFADQNLDLKYNGKLVAENVQSNVWYNIRLLLNKTDNTVSITLFNPNYPVISYEDNAPSLDRAAENDWLIIKSNNVLIDNYVAVSKDASGNILSDERDDFESLAAVSAKWVDGKFGKALQFDGINDYAEVRTGINIAGKSFTIAAWAKRDSTGTNHFIFGQADGAPNHVLHFGFRSTNVFTFAFYYNDLDTPNAYTDNNWHLWVGTYDATTNERKIYRDGVLVASDTASADYQGTGTFYYIGRTAWGNYFDGTIDEARIYNRALTPDEIKTLYTGVNIPNGLVGYWNFDEGTGTTVHDSSGNRNDGYINNDYSGRNGNSLWFNGNKHVEVKNSPTLTLSGAFSIEAWVNISSQRLDLNPVIIAKTVRGPHCYGYGCRWISDWNSDVDDIPAPFLIYFRGRNEGSVFVDFQVGSGVQTFNYHDTFFLPSGKLSGGLFKVNLVQSLTATGTADTWQHWVFVYNRTHIMIYRDGVLAGINVLPPSVIKYKICLYCAVQSRSTDIRDKGENMRIGIGNDNGFNGVIAKLRVYNRSLSANEVQEHYHGSFNNNNSLVGYWDFEEKTGTTVYDKSGNGNNGVFMGDDKVSLMIKDMNTIKKYCAYYSSTAMPDAGIKAHTYYCTGFDNIYIMNNLKSDFYCQDLGYYRGARVGCGYIFSNNFVFRAKNNFEAKDINLNGRVTYVGRLHYGGSPGNIEIDAKNIKLGNIISNGISTGRHGSNRGCSAGTIKLKGDNITASTIIAQQGRMFRWLRDSTSDTTCGSPGQLVIEANRTNIHSIILTPQSAYVYGGGGGSVRVVSNETNINYINVRGGSGHVGSGGGGAVFIKGSKININEIDANGGEGIITYYSAGGGPGGSIKLIGSDSIIFNKLTVDGGGGRAAANAGRVWISTTTLKTKGANPVISANGKKSHIYERHYREYYANPASSGGEVRIYADNIDNGFDIAAKGGDGSAQSGCWRWTWKWGASTDCGVSQAGTGGRIFMFNDTILSSNVDINVNGGNGADASTRCVPYCKAEQGKPGQIISLKRTWSGFLRLNTTILDTSFNSFRMKIKNKWTGKYVKKRNCIEIPILNPSCDYEYYSTGRNFLTENNALLNKIVRKIAALIGFSNPHFDISLGKEYQIEVTASECASFTDTGSCHDNDKTYIIPFIEW